MKVIGELVIDSHGRASLWLPESLTAALNYAVRVHGVMTDCVTLWEAEQEKRAAYLAGLAEGAARTQQAQPDAATRNKERP